MRAVAAPLSSSPAVLVTGGAERIGAAIVRAFAAAGWHTVIHYRSSSKEADALAAELPSASTIACDLFEDDAPLHLARAVAHRHPGWCALVNCASVFVPDDVRELDGDTFDEAVRVNARAPAQLAQAFLRHTARSQPRRVIQVTDQKIANSNPDFFSYTMSKFALHSTIEMLAKGACEAGDRVYGLAPGAILPSHDQTIEEAQRSHLFNLLERRTEADEIADAAVFLSYGWLASGTTLFVDSGQHLLDQDRDVIYLEREART